MKKLIVSFIALTMLLSVISLSSCASKQQGSNNNGSINEGDDRIWYDNLPDIDLQGETVTFVGHGQGNAERFGLEGTFVDETNGDIVNDAMYESTENVKRPIHGEHQFLAETLKQSNHSPQIARINTD